jgi:hypothetical protein
MGRGNPAARVVAEDADSFGSGLLLPVSSPLARAVALPPSLE